MGGCVTVRVCGKTGVCMRVNVLLCLFVSVCLLAWVDDSFSVYVCVNVKDRSDNVLCIREIMFLRRKRKVVSV